LRIKGKATPLQVWTGPEGTRRLRLPDFQAVGMKVAMFSALRTGRLHPQKISQVLISIRGCFKPGATVLLEGLSQ